MSVPDDPPPARQRRALGPENAQQLSQRRFVQGEREVNRRDGNVGAVVVIAVVLGAAAAGALVAGAVAWFLPNFDPVAPHAAASAIEHEVEKEAEAHPRAESYLRSRVDPTRLTGLALTVALGILVLGSVAIGALLVMIQHHAGLAHYDLTAARWGGTNATPRSTQTLRDISQLGGTMGVVVIALVAAVAEYRRTRTAAVVRLPHDRRRGPVPRGEPHEGSRRTGTTGHPSTHRVLRIIVPVRSRNRGRGHVRRGRAARRARAQPDEPRHSSPRGAAFIAVGVATTRVLLGVHWFTDVLAGLAMGWAWFAISSIAFGGRVLQFGQPVEVAKEAAELDAAGELALSRR